MVCFILGGFYALIRIFYYSTFVILSTNSVVLFIVIKHYELYAFYWVPRVNEYFLLFYICVEYQEEILLILHRIYTVVLFIVIKHYEVYTFYWVPRVNEYFLLFYIAVEYQKDILLILRRIYTTSSIELYTIEHQVVSHNR